MAATAAYHRWIELRRPYNTAAPVLTLVGYARAAGIEVKGVIGDRAHLTDPAPEDHTPFPVNPWPVKLPGYWVCAADFADGPHSDVLLAAARSGRAPWVKYLNYRRRRYDVRNGWRGVNSGDTHLHVSVRSDHLHTTNIINPFGGPAMGSIHPDIPDAQVHRDVWEWLALLVGSSNGPRAGDRFGHVNPFHLAEGRIVERVLAATATVDSVAVGRAIADRLIERLLPAAARPPVEGGGPDGEGT